MSLLYWCVLMDTVKVRDLLHANEGPHKYRKTSVCVQCPRRNYIV